MTHMRAGNKQREAHSVQRGHTSKASPGMTAAVLSDTHTDQPCSSDSSDSKLSRYQCSNDGITMSNGGALTLVLPSGP
jgi:hypothetical protein